ncbi:hypothetical protein M2A_2576 [Tepidicaulis marinus]|uniref:Uncharacterized protein n=1 Tax=Tepidicaulis marinus TaxID=1333998 RepID=A0A081BDF9_9HYPH|nr:hypothetical protein M2A_2576 [Tepidicaulis marinus]
METVFSSDMDFSPDFDCGWRQSNGKSGAALALARLQSFLDVAAIYAKLPVKRGGA